jgi:RNA polymerase sigma-70 factor (ECF subfamily)
VTRSFDDCYQFSYRFVLRAVVLLVPSMEDAHDLTQEAYARALARWSDVGELESPEGWVRKVAVNAAIDLTRRNRSRLSAYRLLHGSEAPVRQEDGSSIDVQRAIAALKPAHRQAVVLHYLLDMSVDQIARETGRPAGTVKTNLARGRTALAALLRVPVEVAVDA